MNSFSAASTSSSLTVSTTHHHVTKWGHWNCTPHSS